MSLALTFPNSALKLPNIFGQTDKDNSHLGCKVCITHKVHVYNHLGKDISFEISVFYLCLSRSKIQYKFGRDQRSLVWEEY